MSDNDQMSKDAPEDLRVVAVVQFNHGEALVLSRAVRFVYEQVGNDFVGKDGPFRDYLYYSHGGGAFAGRELSLSMSDGSVKAIKDHWWHGTPKGSVDVPIGDVESLRKCYVFYSGSLCQDDFLALRATYTGCVYPYWDYEKVIKHKDILGRYAHESGRCNVLVKEVKKKHLEAEELRAKVAALEELAAQMYQIAGALGASVEVMDNLHAAAAGEPIPHKLDWTQEVERIQKPIFWYRKHSDGGGYDGPIHDSHIEPVRRESGAWLPLFSVPDARLEKAEKALSRAGFVRNELYGEWKPPVNQVAAELRGRIAELEEKLEATRNQEPVAFGWVNAATGTDEFGQEPSNALVGSVYDLFAYPLHADPVAWMYDWQAPEGLIRDWVTSTQAEIPKYATNIRPLYARPVPAEPVNARQLERIEEAIDAYERFGAICTFEGEPMIHASTLLEIAEIAAEAQQAEPVLPANKTHGDSHAWLAWALHVIRERCPDVLTSHQYDCASKALAAGYAKVPVMLEKIEVLRCIPGYREVCRLPRWWNDFGVNVQREVLRANGYKVEG